MRTIGCYVVELLAANGIDTVFGIPGVHNLELYRGLAQHRALRHILVRHEQNAGFAADGYARVTGRPAAAFVISGPGVSNVLTATAQAYTDSVPLLVVASTPARASLGQRWGRLHELNDQRGVMSAVLDQTATASSAAEVRDCLRQVFTEFRSGRPRPAYLGIPLDVLAQETDLPAERFDSALAAAGIDLVALERAAALLQSARRPAIVAGGGARGAAAGLRRLIEQLDGYLATTAAGKGVLPERHRSNLGCSLPFSVTQRLLGEADIVLAVGTELAETDIYTADRLTLQGKLIRIDIRAAADERHEEAVSLCGDAAALVAALAERLQPRAGWRTAAGDAAVHRAAIEATLDAPSRLRLRGLEAIRAALPADAALFTDMTQIAYLGNYAFATDTPGTWHHPTGYGTLGYAMPAALGAKVARPERVIASLSGDFGLQFTLPDLTTAVELGLSLPVIVWNNAALGQIRDDMIASGIAPLGVVARNPDFIALAKACGARGVRASNAAALTSSIADAQQYQGPTVIEVKEAEFA